MNEIKINNSIFEEIKHFDEFGGEYWLARELMVTLEYKRWDKFSDVISEDVAAHFGISRDISKFTPYLRYSLRDFSQMSDREIVGEVMDLRNLTSVEKDYIKSYKNAYWQGKNLQEEIGRRERGTAGRAYGHLTKKFDEI